MVGSIGYDFNNGCVGRFYATSNSSADSVRYRLVAYSGQFTYLRRLLLIPYTPKATKPAPRNMLPNGLDTGIVSGKSLGSYGS